MEINFKRHLTTHLYELWPEVKMTEEKQQCKKIGCEKQFSNWKFYITHLATVHGELMKQLEEREETLGLKYSLPRHEQSEWEGGDGGGEWHSCSVLLQDGG